MSLLIYHPNENSKWAQVDLVDANNNHHLFPWNQKSGEIFNADPKWLIRIKAICLAVLTPIVTTIRILYHTVMAILHTLIIQPFLLLDGRITCSQAAKQIRESFSDIFRSAFYGLILEGCTLYTIVCPRAKGLYGYFERALNRHLESGPHSDKFYMAPCFQPLVHNEHLNSQKNLQRAKEAEEIALDMLQRHLAWIDKIKHGKPVIIEKELKDVRDWNLQRAAT
jgi:hypothetical protein